MTRRELLDDAVARLEEAGVEGARRSAEWIIEDATGATRTDLYSRPDVVVEPAEAALVERYVARRATGEPVQYVLGHADFYGLRLVVTPDVLIPRPETEEVVEAALEVVGDAPWVLDVGTGSGAIALALKLERPGAEVFAVDVSAAALEVAAGNAERLGLEVVLVRADALQPAFADEVPPTFDLIVSNPPYVPDAERHGLQLEVAHEPDGALFVSDADPLVFYRALVGHALRLLHPGGWLVAETHADYGQDVGRLWREAGLVEVEVRPDLAGRDRIAFGRKKVAG